MRRTSRALAQQQRRGRAPRRPLPERAAQQPLLVQQGPHPPRPQQPQPLQPEVVAQLRELPPVRKPLALLQEQAAQSQTLAEEAALPRRLELEPAAGPEAKVAPRDGWAASGR